MATLEARTDPRPQRASHGPSDLLGRIRISDQALSFGAWLLAISSSELAIHGVGESIRGVMAALLPLVAAVALLTGQRYRRTRLPHWLLASFAATFIALNGFLWAFTDAGTTLHDVHVVSDAAAIGTAFFLLVESFTPGVQASRAASLAGLLSCCGFLLILPALLFGLGPAGLARLLPLIISGEAASVLALPIWAPFVGLVPAVAGLLAGNALLWREAPDDAPPDSSGGMRCRTAQPAEPGIQEARGQLATTRSAGGAMLPKQQRRVIGRTGTVARAVIGLAFLALAWTVFRADLRDVVLGVLVLPAAATLLLALRGRHAPPIRLGAAGHLVTIVIVLLLSLVFSGEVVLLFYGSMMLAAAASGIGGCEVTAVSNWLRGRDDQLGCPLFAPFDALDRASGARPARREGTELRPADPAPAPRPGRRDDHCRFGRHGPGRDD